MQRSPFKGLINNMANTWLQAAELLGFTVHVSTPSGYEIDAKAADLKGSAHYKVFQDPLEACQGADLVTTDVWTSMGYEVENEARKKAFADWCVDEAENRMHVQKALIEFLLLGRVNA